MVKTSCGAVDGGSVICDFELLPHTEFHTSTLQPIMPLLCRHQAMKCKVLRQTYTLGLFDIEIDVASGQTPSFLASQWHLGKNNRYSIRSGVLDLFKTCWRNVCHAGRGGGRVEEGGRGKCFWTSALVASGYFLSSNSKGKAWKRRVHSLKEELESKEDDILTAQMNRSVGLNATRNQLIYK